MKGIRQFVAAAALFGFFATLPASASADMVVLDQSFEPPFLTSEYYMHGGSAHAQTFTVGLAGVLAAVEVLAHTYRGFESGDPLLFEIRRTAASGAPSDAPGDLLANGQMPPSAVGADSNFLHIPLLDRHIAVRPGDELAIVLRAFGAINQDVYGWLGSSNPNYPGGRVFSQTLPGLPWRPSDLRGFDAAFRTFVDTDPVPEPATLLLVSTGLVAGFRLRRRA